MLYRFKLIALCSGPSPIAIEASPKLVKLLTPVRRRISGRSDAVFTKEDLIAYPDVECANIFLSFDDGIRLDVSERIIYTSLHINRLTALIDHGEAPYYGISFIVKQGGKLVVFNDDMDINDVSLVGFTIYNHYALAMEMLNKTFG